MTTQAVHQTTSALSLDDADDDLVHTFCSACSRAWCDGGECELADGLAALDVLCAVCEDLELTTTDCPYCGASPP